MPLDFAPLAKTNRTVLRSTAATAQSRSNLQVGRAQPQRAQGEQAPTPQVCTERELAVVALRPGLALLPRGQLAADLPRWARRLGNAEEQPPLCGLEVLRTALPSGIVGVWRTPGPLRRGPARCRLGRCSRLGVAREDSPAQVKSYVSARGALGKKSGALHQQSHHPFRTTWQGPWGLNTRAIGRLGSEAVTVTS